MADSDLLDLITINRRYELEDALAARKAKRAEGQALYRARVLRSHRARMEAATAFQGVAA